MLRKTNCKSRQEMPVKLFFCNLSIVKQVASQDCHSAQCICECYHVICMVSCNCNYANLVGVCETEITKNNLLKILLRKLFEQKPGQHCLPHTKTTHSKSHRIGKIFRAMVLILVILYILKYTNMYILRRLAIN